MGTVDFEGVRREVCLAYVADEVLPGDYVIVHVGFAIAKVDEEEARRTFELLQQMDALAELNPPHQGAGSGERYSPTPADG
jgi:hydrogenase expression/formation protein HypC